MRKIFPIIVLILIFLTIVTGCGSDSSVEDVSKEVTNDVNKESTEGQQEQKEEEKAKVDESKYIKAGMYKVGTDIQAGEYLIIAEGMGYYQVTKDSSGSFDSIISNDNFSNTRYVTVSDGQYLEIKNAKMILASEAEPQKPANGEYSDGMYKVGKDIPAGEYKIASTGGMAYYEIAKDSTGSFDSIIANDNFEGEKYVTVKEGQYLKLMNCKIVK